LKIERTISPIAQVDVWRAANVLVKQHGDDAAIIAAQQADALLAKGDVEGQRVFKEIVRAINELQRTGPTADERRH
jgi:hypothetical protein